MAFFFFLLLERKPTMETAKRVDKEEKRNGSKILRQRSTDGQTDKIANVKSKTDATEVKGLLD